MITTKNTHIVRLFRFWFVFTFLCAGMLFSGCAREPDGKVMIIGVDGAEWDILRPMLEQGRLPNFGKIISEGASGALQSFTPTLSPVIWTSIATGKNMETHGISWFMIRDPETGEMIPITSRNRKVKALWNILSDAGRTTGTVGWWASWPAEKVNGFVVSDHVAYHGFGIHVDSEDISSDKTYPPELVKEISPLVVQPIRVSKADVAKFLDPDISRFKYPSTPRFEFNNPIHHFLYIYSTMRTYEDVGLHLLDTKKPDFFAVYFEGIDSVGHFFMRYAPPKVEGIPENQFKAFNKVVENTYIEQDRILGRFLEKADEKTTVIVVSDHGFKQGEERTEIVLSTNDKAAQIWHQIDGVVILWGNNIKKGVKFENASVFDVAPTVLYLMGQAVPDDMTGNVLKDALELKYTKDNPIQKIKTYEGTGEQRSLEPIKRDKAVDREYIERLRALGYLSGSQGAPSDSQDKPQAKKDVGQKPGKSVPMDPLLKKTEPVPDDPKKRILHRLKRGQYKQALKELDIVISMDPEDTDMIAFKADTLRLLGNLDGSIKVYQSMLPILEKKPEDTERKMSLSEIYAKLAEIELAKNDMIMAKKFIEKSFTYTDSNPLTHYALGEYFMLNNNYTEAIKALHRAKSLAPQNVFVFNMLGECYMKMGQIDTARTNLSIALQIDPKVPKSLYNLGLTYYEEKNFGPAKEFLEAALMYKGIFKNQLFYLGNIYFADGNLGRANFYYENASKVEPENWEIWVNLARLAKFSNKKDKVIEYMEKAKSLAPEGQELKL